MLLPVHLDGPLYRCCGPELTVGETIEWPLNFEPSTASHPDVEEFTGTIQRRASGPAHIGPGVLFRVEGALLYLPNQDHRTGPARLRGTVRYIDHGYVPEDWPVTCGEVRSIRAGDGTFHHTWNRADGWYPPWEPARPDTVVTVEVH